jgi:hypothetical protein
MSEASEYQSAPMPGKRCVIDQVMADLQERAEAGKAKYGTYLETHNGRDALWDLYQEILDAAMYVRQSLMERTDDRVIALQQQIEILREGIRNHAAESAQMQQELFRVRHERDALRDEARRRQASANLRVYPERLVEVGPVAFAACSLGGDK